MVGCFPIRLDPKECAPIEVVGDPNGELVEALGMYANLGPTLGMRSKRFALVAEDGIVKHVAIDEGAEVCVKTSAQALLPIVKKLAYVPPVAAVAEKNEDQQKVLIGLMAAAIIGAAATGQQQAGMDLGAVAKSTGSKPAPPKPAPKLAPTAKAGPKATPKPVEKPKPTAKPKLAEKHVIALNPETGEKEYAKPEAKARRLSPKAAEEARMQEAAAAKAEAKVKANAAKEAREAKARAAKASRAAARAAEKEAKAQAKAKAAATKAP